MTVGQGGLFEIAAAKLAQKSADPKVKEFADQMIADHTKAGAELTAFAATAGVAPPEQPGAQQQNILDAWGKLTGSGFDCAYIPAEYFDHVAVVGAFEKEAASGTDPRLKAWAQTHLPTIQEHMRMAAGALETLNCGV
jgi:putative membrane protein